MATGTTNVDRLRERMLEDGIRAYEVSWGPKAHGMTVEERAGVLLEVLDAPKIRSKIPPGAGQPTTDVRDFVESLYAECA